MCYVLGKAGVARTGRSAPQRSLPHHGHRDNPGTGPGSTTTMEHRGGQNHDYGALPWLRPPLLEPKHGPQAPPAPPPHNPAGGAVADAALPELSPALVAGAA